MPSHDYIRWFNDAFEGMNHNFNKSFKPSNEADIQAYLYQRALDK